MSQGFIIMLLIGLGGIAAFGEDPDSLVSLPLENLEFFGLPSPVISTPQDYSPTRTNASSTYFGEIFDLDILASRQSTDRFIDDLFDGFLSNAAREGIARGLGKSFQLRDYDQPCLIGKVSGSSMVPLILPGDVAVINRRFPFKWVEANDIIAFISPGFFPNRDCTSARNVKDRQGRDVRINGLHLVVHQVSRILLHPKSGARLLETKGVNNPFGCDPFWVEPSQNQSALQKNPYAVYLGKVIIVRQPNSSLEGYHVIQK